MPVNTPEFNIVASIAVHNGKIILSLTMVLQ